VTSPHFAKSIFGCVVLKLEWSDDERIFLTYSCRSSLRILFFGPEPCTFDKSIPNSLASFLVAGPE